MSDLRAAVFLDRDGVIIEDSGLLVDCKKMMILSGAAEAIRKLNVNGLSVFVVTNQTVVSRGLATELEVERFHQCLADALRKEAGAVIEQFYVCPHHPNADIETYKVVCECRKPAPGMLLRAAREHRIDLKRSFMVGDRISDVVAGRAAGCMTIQVQTGQHTAVPIQTTKVVNWEVKPDAVCTGLQGAVAWILRHSGFERL